MPTQCDRKNNIHVYVTDILKLCVQNRVIDRVGMNWPVKLDVEDLKHVSEILAPINPPATEPLDAEKKSRFLSDNQIEENWFVFVIQARSIDFESGGPDSSKKY